MGNDRTKPWYRWRHGHWGGHPRATQHKVIHYLRIFAEWHAQEIAAERGREYGVYPCRWGDDLQDGETHPLHWHVGRHPITYIPKVDS